MSSPPSGNAPKPKRKAVNKHFKIGVPQTVKLARGEAGLGIKLEEREGSFAPLCFYSLLNTLFHLLFHSVYSHLRHERGLLALSTA